MKNKISNKIAICIADHKGKILSKNEACTPFCSASEGSICQFLFNNSHLSLDHQANLDNTEGMIYRKCLTINNTPVDVVTINDGTALTTFFYSLNDHIQKQLVLLGEYDLSKRELEVASLMLHGFLNEAIAKKLFISKATLKTHINSIYKKIPKNKIHILKTRE